MWELMSCCLCTFSPRLIFQPYVAAFCVQAQRERANPAAAWCLQLLRHVVAANLQRKRLPSDLEMRYARLFQLIVFAGALFCRLPYRGQFPSLLPRSPSHITRMQWSFPAARSLSCTSTARRGGSRWWT